jgi:hypothetical protein
MGLRDVELSELRNWARIELKRSFGPGHSGQVPRVELVLPKLIWSVSWVARLLLLSRGIICDSKREALKRLAQEYIEIREPVGLLMRDFDKPNSEPITINSEQSEMLRHSLVMLAAKETLRRDK